MAAVPPGAGEAVAVDLVDLAGAVEIREVLLEGGAVLPVDGAAVAVEEARPGEEVGAGGERSDATSAPRTARRSTAR